MDACRVYDRKDSYQCTCHSISGDFINPHNTEITMENKDIFSI